MTTISFKRKPLDPQVSDFVHGPSDGWGKPALVTASVAGTRLDTVVARNRDRFRTEIETAGAALFRDFAVRSVDQFRAVADAFAGAPMEYSERSTPRTRMSDGIYTSTEYAADQTIFFHNENSYAATWPALILFWCQVAPSAGGRTPLADTRRVLDLLPDDVRQAFETHGVRYRRVFREGLGLGWRDAFGETDFDALRRTYEPKGYSFAHEADGSVSCTFRTPAILAHPTTGERSWFNHVALFHRSTLPPELREAAEAGADYAAVEVALGNGDPIPDDWAEAIRSAYAQTSSGFDWQEGDVLCVDNQIMAHGREPYTPPRRILVAMADPEHRGAR
jgi:alpha-ketoglutarate-dependent taurine dioxygenase